MEDSASQLSSGILEQVSLFEEKIGSCERSFGASELEFWLGYFKSTPVVRSHGELVCLRQLTELLVRANNCEGGQVYDKPPAKLYRYFDWFFRFLNYLQELNEAFVQQILHPLKLFFRDEASSRSAFVSLSEPGYSTPEGSRPSTSSRSVWEQILQDCDEADLEEIKSLRELYDDVAFRKVIKELEKTVVHWETYLKEDTAFDLDIAEVSHVQPQKGGNIGDDVIYLLRLIPTVLVHCRKAAALAKDWVHHHSLKTLSLEARLEKVKSLQRSLSNKLSDIDTKVTETERLLEKQSEDLQKLMLREERSQDITTRLQENEDQLKSLEELLNKVDVEKQQLTNEIQHMSSNSKDRPLITAMRLKLEEKRLQKHIIQRQVKARQYCHMLLQNDLDLELEVKPTIVRYTNDAQEKCQALEAQLVKSRQEKRQLVSILEPLREDKHRIQEDILRRSLGNLNEDRIQHQNGLLTTRPKSTMVLNKKVDEAIQHSATSDMPQIVKRKSNIPVQTMKPTTRSVASANPRRSSQRTNKPSSLNSATQSKLQLAPLEEGEMKGSDQLVLRNRNVTSISPYAEENMVVKGVRNLPLSSNGYDEGRYEDRNVGVPHQ